MTFEIHANSKFISILKLLIVELTRSTPRTNRRIVLKLDRHNHTLGPPGDFEHFDLTWNAGLWDHLAAPQSKMKTKINPVDVDAVNTIQKKRRRLAPWKKSVFRAIFNYRPQRLTKYQPGNFLRFRTLVVSAQDERLAHFLIGFLPLKVTGPFARLPHSPPMLIYDFNYVTQKPEHLQPHCRQSLVAASLPSSRDL